MKRSTAFLLGLIVLLAIGWAFMRKDGLSSFMSQPTTPTSTTPGPSTASSTPERVFRGDRTRPYALEAQSGTGAQALLWDLTVDNRVQGHAYRGTEVYDAYGEISTSTDSIIVTAYEPAGGVLASATGTWSGARLSGVTAFGPATTTFALREAASSTVSLSFQQAVGTWEDASRQMSCEFSLTLPTVEAGSGVSAAAAARMNQEIRRTLLLLPTLRIAETPSSAQSPEQAKNTYIQACRAELEEEARAIKVRHDNFDDVGGAFRRAQETSVTVTLNRQGWLSFSADTYTYTGGAHGMTFREGFIFDTRTGERLGLAGLVRADKQATFGQRLATELLRQYRDELFDETATALQTFTRSDAAQAQILWNAGASGLSTSTVLYLVPTGLKAVFQQYEVAPYAVGMPEIMLPFARFRDLVSPGRTFPF